MTRYKGFELLWQKAIIILLAISPAFALGDGDRNLLLIGFMYCSPMILFIKLKYFSLIDIFLLVFMITISLFPFVFHFETMRWSTVLYSWMFCFTFLAYKQLVLYTPFSINNYQFLLKHLLYAYCIVLLIQQFCVLTSLPIFNLGLYNPENPWKLNSLAAEPSHSARIVALLMYCYLTTTETIRRRTYNLIKDFKKDRWVWIAFFWTALTMGSSTSFLFIPIILLKFIHLRNVIPLFVSITIVYAFASTIGVSEFERTYNTFIATISFNEEAIINADHSASFRIVPIIVLIKKLDITTLNSWIGHGIDYVSTFMYKHIPGSPKGISGGGLLAVSAEYGIIAALLFMGYTFYCCFDKKNPLISVIFWFMLIFINGVNSQIVWICVCLLFSNVYYNKNEEIKNIIRYGNP